MNYLEDSVVYHMGATLELLSVVHLDMPMTLSYYRQHYMDWISCWIFVQCLLANLTYFLIQPRVSFLYLTEIHPLLMYTLWTSTLNMSDLISISGILLDLTVIV